jgi:hypothetical protein
MAVTVSRFAPRYPVAAPSGAASGPTVEQVLDRKGVIVFRIRSGYDQRGIRRHHLRAYTAAFDVIEFDYADPAADHAIREALLRLMFEQYPHIDWTRDHDVYLADGRILRSPEAWEDGYVPSDDQTFGGAPAVHLPLATGAAA